MTDKLPPELVESLRRIGGLFHHSAPSVEAILICIEEAYPLIVEHAAKRAAASKRAGGMPEEPHVVTHLREQHPSKLTVWEGQIVEYVEALILRAKRLQARVKELESGAGFARAIVDDKLKDAREQAEARLQEALAAVRDADVYGISQSWHEAFSDIINLARQRREGEKG